jgi:hypothetical protein
MQGSLWMAMALCRAEARSLTTSMRTAQYPAIGAAFIDGRRMDLDYLVRTRRRRRVRRVGTAMTNDGENLTNRQRDAHMIQECLESGLCLISRDAQACDEDRNAGVDAIDPEGFAARHVSREDARRMFDERLNDAAIRYLVKGSPQEQNMRIRVGSRVRVVYRSIWQPLEQPVFV